MKPDGTGYVDLLDFNGINGNAPLGSLVFDGTFLYGMTPTGGANNLGVIFKIKTDGTGYLNLLNFSGASNGSNPKGSLIYDGTFLYGTTYAGGANNLGTIFKIKPDGTIYTDLLDFSGFSNGISPLGDLVSDGTFLYGMSSQGGTNNLGVIFKIMSNGTGFVKLLDFIGSSNGNDPEGSLIYDGTFLYGMTRYGGTSGYGVIFKILPNGTGFVKLLNFTGVANGSSPRGSLISDGTFLYGMTFDGGTNTYGTVLKIKTDGTGYIKIFDFAGASNGTYPYGELVSDGTFLYGMTAGGGVNSLGAIFKIRPDGTNYIKIFDFAGITTGSTPTGSLIYDGTFLYGMTQTGGVNNIGTIFKIMPDGTGYTKLLDFSGVANGSSPWGSLISDGTFLYGMTSVGGNNSKGVIFKIQPNGTGFVKLLDFAGTSNGRSPMGTLISDGTYLYGMTNAGGINDLGVIFKIQTNGTGYVKLFDFATAINGQWPRGALFYDGTFLYGMTLSGGVNNMGVIFKILTSGTGYTKLLDFSGTANGSSPWGTLIYDGTFFYGMTSNGGINNGGLIFKIKYDGTGYMDLFDFSGNLTGSIPWGSLITDGTFLYGMTEMGGANNVGAVFSYQLTPTNIFDQKLGNELNVYPNPTDGKFVIDSKTKNAEVEIFNVLGIKVYSKNFIEADIVIDISSQTKGIYFIKIATEEGVATKKIILN